MTHHYDRSFQFRDDRRPVLRAAGRIEFSLMICDLGLPELSGRHVARWVKEHRPELPVIIASGFAEMITEEDYQKARIDEVIRKPYAVSDVLARERNPGKAT